MQLRRELEIADRDLKIAEVATADKVLSDFM
jgi:hypothetical protein